ncbi:phosphoglycolate phosphatase [Fusarium albosuccineum]|uniref:Phosphoglycolate phosphatase n=1 Tax=Fusarium albosuccineum TaxID=1237068 RepID=A0A8H4LES5_9HYPO|nr:phosphoglycolate phosphatase [Fusarium albosuccineum]
MTSIQLVIFDFDGTLFDMHRAISYSIKLTFDSLLPTSAPPEAEVQKLIGNGMGLQDVLKALHPKPESFDQDEWISTYRQIYAEDGQPLVTAFPGAQHLLRSLSARNIPTSIISNKGVAAVVKALENNGIEDIIPEQLIVGDKTPGATRKPDPGSYVDVLVPALKARGVKNIDPSNILVVGDTEADVQFASNIGAKSVWCRFGYGDRATCVGLKPDFMIDYLPEVENLVDNL